MVGEQGPVRHVGGTPSFFFIADLFHTVKIHGAAVDVNRVLKEIALIGFIQINLCKDLSPKKYLTKICFVPILCHRSWMI